MRISGIEAKYQNCPTSSNARPKGSSVSAFDSFQNELVNWEMRVKGTIDKQEENDSSGNLQMSEKQWHHLMKKVDSAIDSLENNIKEQEKEMKNTPHKDTANANI